MINKRKKLSRYRGSHTHGGGAKKKRRGSGHRGGFGMAGSGKRADQKKPMVLKLYGKEYFGKHGFKRPLSKIAHIKILNLEDLERNLNHYLSKNLIKKQDDIYLVNLKSLGYDKLLGSGNVLNKYKILGKVSEKAKLKIEEAGGVIEG